MRVVAAHPHNKKQWQLQIMDDIAQSVACFEEPGALNKHHGMFAAQKQAAGNRNRLALPANADQRDFRTRLERRLPGAELAVGNPDNMRDTAFAESSNYRGPVK